MTRLKKPGYWPSHDGLLRVLETDEETLLATDYKLIGGFTLRELKEAFDKVADPDDWRAPIDRVVPEVDLEVTKSAIIFYTATEPMVEEWTGGKTYSTALSFDPGVVKLTLRGPLFRVESEGYRAGPAGP